MLSFQRMLFIDRRDRVFFRPHTAIPLSSCAAVLLLAFLPIMLSACPSRPFGPCILNPIRFLYYLWIAQRPFFKGGSLATL